MKAQVYGRKIRRSKVGEILDPPTTLPPSKGYASFTASFLEKNHANQFANQFWAK